MLYLVLYSCMHQHRTALRVIVMVTPVAAADAIAALSLLAGWRLLQNYASTYQHYISFVTDHGLTSCSCKLMVFRDNYCWQQLWELQQLYQ